MRSLQIYLILSLLLFLISCDSGGIQQDIPEVIQPYIDLFEAEAAARGRDDIKVEDLIVTFETDLSDNNGTAAAGLCYFSTNSNVVPRIELDTTSVNWQSNEWLRETLVFHELGHCILNRRTHRDDLLGNGNLASIMRSTGDQVYSGEINYFKREYYLDELFNPGVEEPEWAKNIPAYDDPLTREVVFTDEFIQNQGWFAANAPGSRSSVSGGFLSFESQTDEAFFLSRLISLPDLSFNFDIELSIRIESGSEEVMLQWGDNNGEDIYFMGMNASSVVFAGKFPSGVAYAQRSDAFISGDFNVLSMRKFGTYMYMYINGEFFDVYEAPATLPGNLFAFYVGPNTSYVVDYLRIREIN